jgi:hypothetical protein
MKLTKGILAAVLMAGGAWGQNPNIVNNVQNQMTAVHQQQAADSSAALGIESTPASGQAKKPSPVASAPAVKPVSAMAKSATSAKPVSAAAQPAKTPASKPVSESASNNKLENVKVIRHADNVQIEMATREAVTPTVDKLTSPDRVVIQLPATAMATEKSKIAVGEAGIKSVRIGVNGKTPPTTSVVVDLDHAINYEISAGPSDKLVLTLHVPGARQVATNQAAAKPVATTTAAVPAVAKTQPTQKAAAKPVATPPAVSAKKAPVAVVAVAVPKPNETKVEKAPAQTAKGAIVPPAQKVGVAAKPVITKAPAAEPKVEKVTIAASKEAPHPAAQSSSGPADSKVAPIGATADATPKPEEKKWAMNGKRDPFFSPVVQQTSGSGCSTGKKCLEIGQINVRGIVKSQDGFIAVVTNSLNKAYFLHENDPVFNGFVLRITGDSVVFQETYQDKLGKPVTREVTKTVVAPAV